LSHRKGSLSVFDGFHFRAFSRALIESVLVL
jgi:hypothetical protein